MQCELSVSLSLPLFIWAHHLAWDCARLLLSWRANETNSTWQAMGGLASGKARLLSLIFSFLFLLFSKTFHSELRLTGSLGATPQLQLESHHPLASSCTSCAPTMALQLHNGAPISRASSFVLLQTLAKPAVNRATTGQEQEPSDN